MECSCCKRNMEKNSRIQFQEWELDEGNVLRFDSWFHALSENAHREHKDDESDLHRRVDED